MSKDTTRPNQSQFINMAKGWVAGVQANNSGLLAAISQGESNWTNWKLNSLNIPAFIAVNPVSSTPPTATGSNIVGYAAAYGQCPAAGDSVAGDVSTVNNWGASTNTLQLSNQSYDCYA